MSHLTRVRADYAAWAIGTGVSAAEFEKFDANLFKAINGDDGGTWAPSAPIVLGGEGMRFVGSMLSVASDGWFEIYCSAIFGGSAQFDLAANFVSGFTVANTGTAIFNGAATFNGTTTMQGSFVVSGLGSATFNSTATFAAAAIHNGTTTFNGSTSLSGAWVSTGDVTINPRPVTEDNVFTVNVQSTFTLPLTVNSHLRAYGNTTLGNSADDALNVGATTTFTAPITSMDWITTDHVADGNTEVRDISTDTDIWEDQAHTVICRLSGANRTAIMRTTGASRNGREVWVTNGGTSYNLTLRDEATSRDFAVLAPGETRRCVRAGGQWY